MLAYLVKKFVNMAEQKTVNHHDLPCVECKQWRVIIVEYGEYNKKAGVRERKLTCQNCWWTWWEAKI